MLMLEALTQVGNATARKSHKAWNIISLASPEGTLSLQIQDRQARGISQNNMVLDFGLYGKVEIKEKKASKREYVTGSMAWQHVALAQKQGKFMVYIDGKLKAILQLNSKNTAPLALGGLVTLGGSASSADGNGFTWIGSVDEIGIWNQTLSSNAIQQLVGQPYAPASSAMGSLLAISCLEQPIEDAKQTSTIPEPMNPTLIIVVAVMAAAILGMLVALVVTRRVSGRLRFANEISGTLAATTSVIPADTSGLEARPVEMDFDLDVSQWTLQTASVVISRYAATANADLEDVVAACIYVLSRVADTSEGDKSILRVLPKRSELGKFEKVRKAVGCQW